MTKRFYKVTTTDYGTVYKDAKERNWSVIAGSIEEAIKKAKTLAKKRKIPVRRVISAVEISEVDG